MNTIRTTISLEENLHRYLLTRAFNSGKTLSQIVNEKLKNSNFNPSQTQLVKNELAFFARLGQKAGKTDWVKMVRRERDRNK